MTTTPEQLTQEETIASLGTYGYGWADSDVAGAAATRGLNEAVVREPAGETLLVYRGCGNADDGRAVTLKRNGVLITVSQR